VRPVPGARPHRRRRRTPAVRRARRPDHGRPVARPAGVGSPARRRPQTGAGRLMPFSPVEDAVAAIRRGGMAVVVDDEDRENEGDLVMAAEAATPETIAFFLAHTSGVICVPLLPERADELDLPLMVADNTEAQRTAFTVTVDARNGTTTGISAADRATTIATLI